AWGAGDVGQLGDGNMGGQYSVLAPKRVQGLPSNIVSIDAGAGGSGSSSFAVTSDGKVYGWGNNFNGQLGDNRTDNANGQAVPELIPGLNGFKGISTSGTITLGLKNDGSVWAWGYNQDGEAGSGIPVGT